MQQKHDEAKPVENDSPETSERVDLVEIVLARAKLTTVEHEFAFRRFVHGQSVSDIAYNTGYSQGAVARILTIAKDKLQSALRSTGDAL